MYFKYLAKFTQQFMFYNSMEKLLFHAVIGQVEYVSHDTI